MAILVDNKIYWGISDWLNWYATDYIQNKLPDTKALVIPLDLTDIHAYDIYRMMENIYFDGLKDVNSTLIWLIMFGDIPLPVANQNWYIFPTVYPYVDFEDQKYVWDEESQYFVPNKKPMGQAEVWHGLINYWTDIQAYLDFFGKIQAYVADPDDFIWDSMWYDDFIWQKKGFMDENYPYYRNRVIFGEDLWYQRHSPLMKKMFRWEENDNAMDIIWELEEAAWIEFEWRELAEEIAANWMHSTKMVQQEIWTSFRSDYSDLFSKMSSSTMRENVFAWWRWIKEYDDEVWEKSMMVDSDGSIAKMQLKDDMLLWNNSLQWLIENLNDLMENMIDKKIESEHLGMDIVVPTSYKVVTKKRVDFKCYSFVDRYENYYFWDNARLIDEAENLSIYRWTYRNLENLSWVTYGTLLEWKNPAKSEYDPTDLKLKSIWWSYDIFSSQAEWNRWYTMLKVEDDLDVYDEEKTTKDPESYRDIFSRVKRKIWPKFCDDDDDECETLFEFAKRWWWWASSINLDSDSVNKWKYELKDYLATDSWRPIFWMDWFQSLQTGDDEWMNWIWWHDWKWKWPQWAAVSFKAYIKYSSPTQREWWNYPKLFSPFYVVYENHTPDVHIPFSKIDYWQLKPGIIAWRKFSIDRDSSKIFNIRKTSWWILWCYWKDIQYDYKVISSVVKHKSTTEDQINWIDRDKYWESGTLGKYFHDIRVSYEDVQEDMDEILDTFPELIDAINSGDAYIRLKMKDLEAEMENVKSLNKELSGYNDTLSWLLLDLEEAKSLDVDELESSIEVASGKLSKMDEKISSMQETLSWMLNNLNNVEGTALQNLNKDIKNLQNSINELQDQRDNLSDELEKMKAKYEKAKNWTDTQAIEDAIKDTEANIDRVKKEKEPYDKNIDDILAVISEYIEIENSKLTDIYKLVMWLYVENIISVMEFIIYLEWWNPNDYHDWWSSANLKKIWFLSSRISEINDIQSEINDWKSEIVDKYDKVYSLITKQQEDWEKLAEKLIDEWGFDEEKVDKVSEEMEQVLTVEDNGDASIDDEDEDDEDMKDGEYDEKDRGGPVTLTWWSASDAMKEFSKNFDKANSIFSRLIEQDKVWPAIISAAKSDPDFLKWMVSHSVKFWSFSDVDWINQYAQRAKWPWYDSAWARKNHDLLAWVSEHMSWMNILTPDRPIDSPRYVVMQSVAWNEMKFIYPDLFKVEVYEFKWKNKSWYDIHELLTWWQIKEKLIKYLKWKVSEYNTIIDNECANARTMDLYYSRLRSIWYPLATPDKALHSCGSPFSYDEFVEALWWEKMLSTISEVLYYQSLTNKSKLSSWNVQEDIDLIKKSFSLNEKREQVLQDYLVEWNEKIKHPIFEIPTYELLWYEVAYVNSDWKDYIFPADDLSQEFTQETVESTSESFDIDRRQSSNQEKKIDEECGVPSSWKLPILKIDWSSPWFKWFKCWLKKTIQKPITVKLKFDNSLWEILSPDSLKENVKEPTSSNQSFMDWGNATQYADKWDEIKEKWEWYDADKAITQMQVEAEKHNQEVMWWGDWLSNVLSNIYRNVKISNTNLLLSDSNTTSDLRIESASDVWNVSVKFIWTWEWCLKVENNKLCKGDSFTKTFNPKTDPFECSVGSADNVAWKSALIIQLGVGGWWYIENVLKYTVSPSTLDKVYMDWKDVIVAWMITPIAVTWYDKNWNVVSWWLENYDFTASIWRFLKDWAYQPSFTTNDFRKLDFYYQAPLDAADWSVATIQMKSALNGKVVWTYAPKIVKANPVIKINGTVVLQWKDKLVANASYKLSSNESIYAWSKLNVSKLKRIELDMIWLDWKNVDVDSQVLFTSQNGLLVFWQVQKDEKGEDIFFETSKVQMEWWHVIIYFYPTTVAWNDIINIDIPWLDTRSINFKVSPSKLANVQLDITKEYVKLKESTDFEIFTTDVWWNQVGAQLFVTYDQTKVRFPSLIPYAHPEKERYWVDIAIVEDWYLKTPIYWTWAWLTEVVTDAGWSVQFKVDKNILPEKKLNILYLNYFWNDWWNQWWYFSDNDNYVEDLMKESNKIITTTTQLVSENKIKKLLWKIEPWFQIKNTENIDTIMTMKDGNIDMIIWWISEMVWSLPSFEWMTVPYDTVNRLLSNESNAKKNYAFFVSKDSKYKIENWVLFNWNERLWSLLNWEITLQLSNETLFNWDNVWTVIDRWIVYGDLIIHYPKFMPDAWKFSDPWERYLVSPVFAKGSTDIMSSVWLFDSLTDFELETSYKSIQDSDDVEEKVWFLWTFKNITLFGEWETVWEATKKFWSELLINLWDPVLTRKWSNEKVYGTEHDEWIWQEVYIDSENDIFWVYRIDFNRDWAKDWLFVYLDWSFKLAKNYWSSTDIKNLQELMRVAVHIQEVFVGDADGNWYEDILVLTDNNQIRAYLNNWWIFDVDWSVACLNQNVFGGQISSTPSSLEWVNQFFVEDMDLDGATDIITYDKKWYIKVFFWWSTSAWPNYLSTEKYTCDKWWYNREAPNTTIVAALWVQVWKHSVFDNSMMHWVWMWKPEIEITEDELPDFWINFDPNDLEKYTKPRQRRSDWSIDKVTREIMDKDKFDVKKASAVFKDSEAKFVDTTLYENTLVWWWDWKNYVFAPSSFLDPDNPDDICSVWKNYRVKRWWSLLMDWDIVTVTVTVKASDLYSCVWAFGDIIQWPWNVYYDKDEIIEWIRPGHNWRNAVVKKKDWNFSYIVDNITLSPGETMSFEYDLEYHHLPVKKVSITYETFYSDWPDIKVQSVDWCDKDFEVYYGWGRSFPYEYFPLQDMIDDEYAEEDEYTEDFAEDVISYWSDANKLPWIVWDRIDRVKLLMWNNSAVEVSNDANGKSTLKNTLLNQIQAWWLWALNMNLVVDLSVLEEKTDEIEEIVDDITKWMCNWFSFWWSSNCKWLPVPFNQAFLAPGKYHLFGCWDLPMWDLENWIPMFHFPWTLDLWTYKLPIPWGLKMDASDKFIWAGNWVYPSFIRIYAAPTLTAQLWIAVCMWPYSVGAALKSPWADIGWNCVVFAVKPQCKNGTKHSEKKKDRANPNAIYDKFVEEVRDSWICLQSTKWPMSPNTPFGLYSFSSSYHWDEVYKDPIRSARDWFNENVDVNWWSNSNVDYSLNFLWLINLETTSYVWPDDDTDKNRNQIFIWDVDVSGWDYDVNKIKWWIQQWVRKLLIDKWLDPQIRYIVNHITKMHVNIKLPDFSNVIDTEIQTLKEVSENFWEIWTSTGDKQKMPPMTRWSDINYNNMKLLNKSISNPFDALASLMNESNIINISTEPITVKVPIIFQEDIDSYWLYLQQWLEVNQDRMNRWKTLYETASASCWKEKTEKAKQECYETTQKNLNDFVQLENWNWKKMQNQIYANLMTLQEYRNFPFEIYEWIHVEDSYVSEIAALINNTIGYLSHWTTTNSQRFVGYVDAIVLILNIIRTYQVLIDFSIEWWQNCGNCSKDTYDQYSCKLSMLCDMIQMPIFQIPNFKLPNITIDLTNIDLGLDIILPDFNFQPVRINLPDIPNIPEPGWINIKLFDLPSIPVLPEPPELPELPSFIPEVELELPILPPAPELPKLPSEIEAILKVAKLIWKIYCIVKWKFWLVWEKSVKAKIEQLTQRTYDVKWIDTIMDFTNWSVAPIHNYGVDYEITSYVDLQFNFTDFYNYLDALTKSINSLTTSSVNWLNNETNSIVNDNPAVRMWEAIDWARVDVKLWMNDNVLPTDVDWLLSDEVEYVDYESAKARLEEVLAYFKSETVDTTLWDVVNSSVNKIENQINKPNSVVSNSEWLEKVRSDVLAYLNEEKSSYDEIANMINDDYEWFLAMVDSQYSDVNVKSNSDEKKMLTFNVNLFNVDSSTKDTIDMITKSNPYESLLDNKKTIIDGYWNAINTNSASDLWLSKAEYLVLRDNIWKMRNQVTTLYSVTRPVSTTQLIAKNSRISSDKTLLSSAGWARLWSNMEVADVIDPSVLSKWIYDEIMFWPDKWKLTKVIYADSFASAIGENYYHYPHAWNKDIIMWDEDAVYLKCAGWCPEGWWGYSNFYVSKVVKEIPYEETWLSFTKDTVLKIADKEEEVKNWKVVGQTYDLLTFTWDLRWDVDAYLIKLVERIDHSYEKGDYTSLSVPVHYALAIPEGVSLESLYSKNIKLELLRKTDTIKNLLWKEVVQVVYYDGSKKTADAILNNVDRKWYYARISALNLDGDTYNIDSPWSNQVVAWRQIVWDDQAPLWLPTLYRPSVPEITSQWDDLDWYVWTRYQLIVNWEDNVALYYINLSKDWVILDEKYTAKDKDTVSTNIDIHTKEEKEVYNSMWVDQFWNKTEKVITVNYAIPEITITDISNNSDWETVSVIAELSQDIDQWNVSFQRRRWNSWKTMQRKSSESADISIWKWDTIIVWSPFSAWNDIAMYDKNGGVLAMMDPDTAEIKIQEDYKDSYELKALVQDSPVVQVCNKETKDSVFSISIPTERCVKIEANNYKIVDLPVKWNMWMFNWWKAVYKDWTNVLFASQTCHLYSELWLEWTYEYDRELDAVVLTLYQLSDLSKKYPIKVWFKVKSFLEN